MGCVAGTLCATDTNECASNPCQNAGTCTDRVNGYDCSCVSGWDGTWCENDIDECISVPCQHAGTCTDQVDGYVCACFDGYAGKCTQDILGSRLHVPTHSVSAYTSLLCAIDSCRVCF